MTEGNELNESAKRFQHQKVDYIFERPIYLKLIKGKNELLRIKPI